MSDMNQSNPPGETNNQELDEQLAAFADQVMAASQQPDQPILLAEDLKLRSLQETILRLRENLRMENASPEFHEQVKAWLAANWSQPSPSDKQGELPSTDSWSRLGRRLPSTAPAHKLTRPVRRFPVLRLAAVFLALVGMAALFSPGIRENLLGTAGGAESSLPLIMALSLGLIVIIAVAGYFLDRRR